MFKLIRNRNISYHHHLLSRRRMRRARVLLYVIVLLLLVCLSLPHVAKSSVQCKAWLVQSIPTDMPNLPRVSGVLSTGDVFQWLANNSTTSLDIIAQYWQLLATPNDPRSGGFGYSDSDLQRFGAHLGSLVYNSIDNAANRNVNIRLLSHSGVYPEYTKEPSDLAFGRSNVKNVTLLLSKWWGSGIVHAKVWISDDRDVYIGSANNDWKSLTQLGNNEIEHVLAMLFSKYQVLSVTFSLSRKANVTVSNCQTDCLAKKA